MKLMQLKVSGQESVTVPAGTFDAFRVEVTPADGGAEKTTLWIATDRAKTREGIFGDATDGWRGTHG